MVLFQGILLFGGVYFRQLPPGRHEEQPSVHLPRHSASPEKVAQGLAIEVGDPRDGGLGQRPEEGPELLCAKAERRAAQERGEGPGGDG